jgi:hypothetical protein
MRTVNHVLVHHWLGSQDSPVPLCEYRESVEFAPAPDLKIRCPKCRRRCE